ncbi:60S ribosomal protein L9-like [Triticum aestivum]|uniref:60S ribosomal protein L9-like n=1 Tax=Triticum aestivum TaxID=4565 RepID=UPI001D01479A|nr:60S ribosomal protein L9-like [Triticum aestivum]
MDKTLVTPAIKDLTLPDAPPPLAQHNTAAAPPSQRRRRRKKKRWAKIKTILASETMEIPKKVTVKVSAKMISVTGPRGTLTRNFKHLNLDFQLQEGGRKLKVDAWFGTRKTMAAIRTAISHVQNLITGVTKGFRYKMGSLGWNVLAFSIPPPLPNTDGLSFPLYKKFMILNMNF